MKGVKCIKYKKFSIILLLLFVVLFSLLNVSDIFAITKDYSNFQARILYSSGSDYEMSSPLLYTDMLTNVKYLNGIRPESRNLGSIPSNTNYINVAGKFNLVAQCDIDTIPDSSAINEVVCPHLSGDPPTIWAVNVNGSQISFISDSLSVYVTDWVRPYVDNGIQYYIHNRTFTYEYSFIVNGTIPSQLDNLAFFVGYTGRLEGYNNRNYIYYFESDPNNRMLVDFTTDKNTALLQQQVQIQQMTLDALSNLNNNLSAQNNQDSQDREDLQNTSDSAESDADSAAANINNAKTSLLTVIGNFINVVINPPPSNCVIDADMGNMDLGDIDLCQLSLPPAFAVIGTLLIIGFIIPFAYSLIMTVLSLLKGATDN